jgi:hypothetical protein
MEPAHVCVAQHGRHIVLPLLFVGGRYARRPILQRGCGD